MNILRGVSGSVECPGEARPVCRGSCRDKSKVIFTPDLYSLSTGAFLSPTPPHLPYTYMHTLTYTRMHKNYKHVNNTQLTWPHGGYIVVPLNERSVDMLYLESRRRWRVNVTPRAGRRRSPNRRSHPYRIPQQRGLWIYHLKTCREYLHLLVGPQIPNARDEVVYCAV